MLASSFSRFFPAMLLVLGISPFAWADPTLTVHNQTGKPITIRQWSWSWLLGSAGSPRLLDWKCRCLWPGTKFTYQLQGPDQHSSSDLVIRRRPEGGLIHHQGLVIEVADPDSSCPCPPSEPEPEAEAAEASTTENLELDDGGDETASPIQKNGYAAPLQTLRSAGCRPAILWGTLPFFPDGILAPHSVEPAPGPDELEGPGGGAPHPWRPCSRNWRR